MVPDGLSEILSEGNGVSEVFTAEVHMNAIFPPFSVGLMKISRSRFKQSKNPLLISRSYVVECFKNIGVIFWICLGGNSFSQRICKI